MISSNPVESLLQLSAGYYISRALHAVAELGVADALGDTPQATAALADTTASHAGALERVLRLLSQYGVFEYNDGVVVHTPLSRMLRQDHPQSMRSLVRMRTIDLTAPVTIGSPIAISSTAYYGGLTVFSRSGTYDVSADPGVSR